MDCAFCNIIKGKISSTEIYRDKFVLCVLEEGPINLGHSLIVTVEHYSSITAVPKEILEAMIGIAPRIGQAIVREVKADGFNLHLANGRCAGQVFLHTCLHVIPRFPTDGFSWGWRNQPPANAKAKNQLAENVVKRLNKSNI